MNNDNMYQWTETKTADKTVYSFQTPHVQASLYRTSAPQTENGEYQYYFQANTNVIDDEVDGYFHAVDDSYARHWASKILYDTLATYQKHITAVMSEVNDYMDEVFL